MKTMIATIGFFMILVPFTLLFVLAGVVFLEMSFGIAPPIALVTISFVLSIFYGIIWIISVRFKSFKRQRVMPKERLLTVQFLQEKKSDI